MWNLEVFVSLHLLVMEKLALGGKVGQVQILWLLPFLDLVTCQKLSSNGSCKKTRKQRQLARDQAWKPL